MITKEEIKNRYDIIHEHFTLKDLIGLSSLIFGLALSNTTFERPVQVGLNPVKPTVQSEKKKAEPVKKAVKKKRRTSKKKKAVRNRKKQRVTAARSH